MEKYSTGLGEKTSLFFAPGSQGPSAWANEPSLFEDALYDMDWGTSYGGTLGSTNPLIPSALSCYCGSWDVPSVVKTRRGTLPTLIA